MVTLEHNPDTDQYRVILRPNTSLSWQEMKYVLAMLAIIIMVIALSFARIGAWLVLPFSGLEIAVLSAAFYMNACYTHQYEVIIIDHDTIEIIKGRRKHTHELFSRAWAKAILNPPWHHWHPSQLVIRSHGKEVIIGDFLREDERQALAIQLETAIRLKAV